MSVAWGSSASFQRRGNPVEQWTFFYKTYVQEGLRFREQLTPSVQYHNDWADLPRWWKCV